MKASAIVRKLVEDSNNYRTEVDVDVEGLESGWMADGKVSVTWSLEMDARSWGVKDIVPVILSVEGSVETTFTGDAEDQTKELPISWQAGDPAFTVDTEFNITGSAVFPKSVNVDLRRKRMTVAF